LTAKSEQNQQLADKVGELEADVSRLKAESLKELAGLQSRQDASLEHLRLSRVELEAMSAQARARFERKAEQHAEDVQQLQQQRDREARVHSEEVTRLRALLEVGKRCNMPHKEHHMQCAVTSWYHHLNMMCHTYVMFCLQVPGHILLSVKSISLAQLGKQTCSEKCCTYSLCDSTCAWPAKFLNCLCLSVTRLAWLSQWSCNCMALSKLALFDFESVALSGVACTQTASLVFSVQARAAVPDKQPNNLAANIPNPNLAPVGAGKAVPAFPSPYAKGIVSSEQATPAPAAGSSQVIHTVL